MDYCCEITEIHPRQKQVFVRILNVCPSPAEPHIKASLYQAIAKGDKFEYAVQKCVEMGIFEIIPITTEYTLAKDGLSENKLKRLQAISEAAAKQSMRGIIPRVLPATSLEQAIMDSKRHRLAFAPYENERRQGIKSFLSRKIINSNETAGIFIGPEGGFSPGEVTAFEKNGIERVSLGPRILRAETAGLVALSAMFYEFDELRASNDG
jgi:16S rRNA (uracil1498-N3)-methyltransferase